MQLPRVTRRAFADLAVYMAAFGLLIGLVFPFFTLLLGVPAGTALRPQFAAVCLAAGLVVGTVNFALAHSVVGARVRRLATGMDGVRSYFAAAVDHEEAGPTDTAAYKLAVDSTDSLGTVAEAFNALIDAVARAHGVERAIAAATTAVARQLDVEPLAEAALDAVLDATGAAGGAVLGGGEETFSVLAHRNLPAELPAELLDRSLPADGRPARAVPWEVTPLWVGSILVGALVLDLRGAERPGQARLLAVLGDTLAVALANAELHARIHRQACIDDLTGLANRRTGLDRLAGEFTRRVTRDDCLGVLLLDVDHFKRVNDTFGHQVGDELLRHLAETAKAQLRPGDLLCRYGGEELLAVLPGADAAAVEQVAERLRTAIATTPLVHPVATVNVTVSIGGASRHPGATRLERLVHEADQALYEAKSAGRNQVRIAGPELVAAR